MNKSSLQDKFPCGNDAQRTARNYARLASIMMPMLGDALSPLMEYGAAHDHMRQPADEA